MINAEMRSYNYFKYGTTKDSCGQFPLPTSPSGSIKIAITILNQSTEDSIKFKDASYIGLTHDAAIDDTFVIQYGNERLKVLYVQEKGRFKQVFLKNE